MNASRRTAGRGILLRHGFSLIELLVTIFLFGLVMAAMFPVFVLALKTNSGDAARNIALNIAQDRIEKIRQLDFDDIAVANLNDAAFFGGEFGPQYVYTRNGSSKVYNVAYAVKSDSPTSTSKQVTVRVSWEGLPKPVKVVELKTVVYRQWSGPQIATMWVDPLPQVPTPDDFENYGYDNLSTEAKGQFANEHWLNTLYPEQTVRVFINPSEVDAMTGTDSKGDPINGWVSLLITAPGGTPLEQKRDTPDANKNTLYAFPWTIPSAPDAMYTITATAYSFDKSKGNTVSIRVRLETGPPSAPEGLSVVGSRAPDGTGQALLTWNVSAALDVMCYQVVRYDGPDSPGVIVASQLEDPPSTWLKTPAFTDGVTYRDPNVSYQVYAIDQTYKQSTASERLFIDWDASGPEPPAPTDLTATVNGRLVQLVWQQPTDTTNVGGYQVFRDGQAIDYVTGLSASCDQEYSTSSIYQVRSANLQGANFSGWASIAVGQLQQAGPDGLPWLLVTTGAQPTYDIHVLNMVPLKTNEQLTARLFMGAGGSGNQTKPLLEWIGLAQGATSSPVMGQVEGSYSVEWRIINTKSGKVVQDWLYKDFVVPVSAGTDQLLPIP